MVLRGLAALLMLFSWLIIISLHIKTKLKRRRDCVVIANACRERFCAHAVCLLIVRRVGAMPTNYEADVGFLSGIKNKEI
jgi:hypothetical protein